MLRATSIWGPFLNWRSAKGAARTAYESKYSRAAIRFARSNYCWAGAPLRAMAACARFF